MNNNAFIQRWQQALFRSDISAGQKVVLAELSWMRNSRTGDAWPSNGYVAEQLGVDVKTVNRAMQSGVEHGFLRKVGKKKFGVGQWSVRYVFEIPEADESVTFGAENLGHTPEKGYLASPQGIPPESEGYTSPGRQTSDEPLKEPQSDVSDGQPEFSGCPPAQPPNFYDEETGRGKDAHRPMDYDTFIETMDLRQASDLGNYWSFMQRKYVEDHEEHIDLVDALDQVGDLVGWDRISENWIAASKIAMQSLVGQGDPDHDGLG